MPDLFDLLVQRDFHLHSAISRCAKPEMTLANILERALRLGVQSLGLTDHIHRPEDVDRLLPLLAEIAAVRADGQRDIYFGCELDLVGLGRTAAPVVDLAAYEFVNVAVNHFHLRWVDAPPEDPAEKARYWLSLMDSASRLDRCDMIVHPFGPLHEPYKDRALFYALPTDELRALFTRLAQEGIALELRDLLDHSPTIFDALRDFYRLALSCGVKLAPNTDAHSLDRMGVQFTTLRLARDIGFVSTNLWRVEESRSAATGATHS